MTTTTAAVHISSVYPVARAFGFGEPSYETVSTAVTGTTFGATAFVKGDRRVIFYSTNGVVDEASVVEGKAFLCTAESDAPQIGLRGLAGVALDDLR